MSTSSEGVPSITVNVLRRSVIRKVSHEFPFFNHPDGTCPTRVRSFISLFGEES